MQDPKRPFSGQNLPPPKALRPAVGQTRLPFPSIGSTGASSAAAAYSSESEPGKAAAKPSDWVRGQYGPARASDGKQQCQHCKKWLSEDN